MLAWQAIAPTSIQHIRTNYDQLDDNFYNEDRKSVVQGKSVDLGGRRIIKKKTENKKKKKHNEKQTEDVGADL